MQWSLLSCWFCSFVSIFITPLSVLFFYCTWYRQVFPLENCTTIWRSSLRWANNKQSCCSGKHRRCDFADEALNSCSILRERTDHSFNQYALSDYRLQWLALSFLNLIFHFVFCSLSTFLLYGCTVMWDNFYLLLFITFSSVYLMFSM